MRNKQNQRHFGRKTMRNPYLQKYFSLSISLIDYALSEIDENMRNKNRNIPEGVAEFRL